jgi:hypothetical protein
MFTSRRIALPFLSLVVLKCHQRLWRPIPILFDTTARPRPTIREPVLLFFNI